MLRCNKNRSIILTLRDRELGNVTSPHILSLSVVSQLIRLDHAHYEKHWLVVSPKPITYEGGLLYFDNYASVYTVHGPYSRPKCLYRLQKSKANKRIADVLTYSSPIFKCLNDCFCGTLPCTCLSRFLMTVSEDNWLCQYNEQSGRLLKEVYVNGFGHNFSFKHCDWDIYGERVVLTSVLNPNQRNATDQNSKDVVVYLAVFKVFPLEFYALIEIRRSVFGRTCNHVNVCDQHLILGMGRSCVHIYNFSCFLQNGILEPYKLGQQYHHHGKVGSYPTGLPFNFHSSTAPPLLFDVQCFGQAVNFGGFPYHYVIASEKNPNQYSVRSVNDHVLLHKGILETNVFNDEPDVVIFHPDNSNRLLFRDSNLAHCFQVADSGNKLNLKKAFTMAFPQSFHRPEVSHSSFGREIRKKTKLELYERTIFCLDYEDELDLLGILGVRQKDPLSSGFVALFDSFTGEEIRCIRLEISLFETNFYQLYIDMTNIIIIEKNSRNIFSVFKYGLEFF